MKRLTIIVALLAVAGCGGSERVARQVPAPTATPAPAGGLAGELVSGRGC